MSGGSVPLLCKVTIAEKRGAGCTAVGCVEQGVTQGCIAPMGMEEVLHV